MNRKKFCDGVEMLIPGPRSNPEAGVALMTAAIQEAEQACNRCRTWTPLYVNGLGTCADLGTAVAAHWGGTCPRFLREVG